MLELRKMKGLILRRDRLLWAIWCTMQIWFLGIYTSSHETDNVGKSWEVAETGRFLHSISPRVSLRPWFEEWRTERKLITTVLRIISGHCRIRAHLKRFSIVDGSICVCLEGHVTVDRIIWKCSRFSAQRVSLIETLLLSGVSEETPIRDFSAQLNCKALKECFMFFVECAGMKM
jgi:hypothetical protein